MRPALLALALAALVTAPGGGEAAGPTQASSPQASSAQASPARSAPALPAAPPPAPLSTALLPVTVPLASLQAAADARVPATLAALDQEYSALGGLVRAQLSGDVQRSGPLTLAPDGGESGGALVVTLPVVARLHVAPAGVGDVLTRDFSGSAVVTARLTPTVSADWGTHFAVSADYRWTDPISFEIVRGVRVNVQSLVDPQLRAQLARLGDALGSTLAQNLNLKAQAGALWARLGTPWTLPLPLAASSGTAYAAVRPQSLSASPLRFTASTAGGEGQARVVLGAAFRVSAGLLERGAAVPVTALPPLPPLVPLPDTVLDEAPGPGASPAGGQVHLQLPLLLPYGPLSQAASALAARQDYPLPLPLSPRLRAESVTLAPDPRGGQRLTATVRLRLLAFGLSVGAVVDVTGTPQLRGHLLTLPDAEVHTRSGGLSGRVLGWLADARVQRLVREQARFDLAPALEAARAGVQARLPYTPAPGLTLSGAVRSLDVTALEVGPAGLLVHAAADGRLSVQAALPK